MKHHHFMAVSVLTDQVNYIDIHYGSRKVPPEGSWINQLHRGYAILFHTQLECDINRWAGQNCMQ